MKNKLLLLLLLLSILYSLKVYSVSTCPTVNDLDLVFPYYMDFNSVEEIRAYYTGDGTNVGNNSVWIYIKFENTTANFTFDNEALYWYVSVKENVSEKDVVFNVTVYNVTNQSNLVQCGIIETGKMRWRSPYNLTFVFYKGKFDNYTTQTDTYENEFQYVYLQFDNESPSFTQTSSWMFRLFNWIPYYKDTIGKNLLEDDDT